MSRKIIFPAGLLVPHFHLDEATGELSVDRLRIRKTEVEQGGARYHTVAGSKMVPLCIGLRPERPALIVESDLDAVLVAQLAGDLAGVIAMGSVSNRPDPTTYRILKRLPLIVVALDTDGPGALESHRYWNNNFHRCVRCPIPHRYGKDPGEAFGNGLDIRLWVVSALAMAGWPLANVPARNSRYPESARPSVTVANRPILETADGGPGAPDMVQHAGGASESYRAAFSGPPCSAVSDEVIPQFEYVTDADAAKAAVAALLTMPGSFGADIETAKHPDHAAHPSAGLDPYLAKIRLIQLYAPCHPVYVFDMFKVDLGILAPLWDRPMVFHNALFDLRHLICSGANPTKVGCTMLMDNCLSGELRSLATLAAEHLGLEVSKEQQVSDWSADTLTDEQLSYAALDAYLVHCLHVKLLARITEDGLGRCYTLMRNAQRALAEMMLTGIKFDMDSGAHAEVVREWEAQRDAAKARAAEMFGPDVDLNSPAQVAAWFEGNLDPDALSGWPRTKTGKLSTAAEDLAACSSHPAVLGLAQYKGFQTLLSTFGEPYLRHINPVTGRMHGGFGFGAATGRLRCGKPNVQNCPKQKSFRSLFVARPGCVFIKADYNQMQLRGIAELSGDLKMLAAFREGQDIHFLTAAAITGKDVSQVTKEDRSSAKSVNFGFSFGLMAESFRKKAKAEYGMDFTLEEASRIRRVFFQTYAGVEKWQRRIKTLAERTWSVTTPGGRVRRFPRKGKRPPFTEAVNTPVQGGEAEVLLSALATFPERLAGLDAKIVNLVHDECLFEVAEADIEKAISVIEEVMCQAMLAIFPNASTRNLVDITVGTNWGNTAKYQPEAPHQ
jgi:DNA polymerase-1